MNHSVKQAISAFENNQLVAIPTETVYGLAAPINNIKLIEKIFFLKKRPFYDPLICHISDKNQISLLSDDFDPLLLNLAQKFWPGPLTFVVPKLSSVSDMITSGLDSVAIRMPDHPLTLELITEMKIPLAAPSANLFGKVSPTSESHVTDSFKPDDVFVLRGGDCKGGIESTVVKLDKSKKQIVILRPGLVTLSMLAQNPDVLKSGYSVVHSLNSAQESPGQLAHHYMPDKPLCLIDESSNMDMIKSQFATFDFLQLPAEAVLAARDLYGKLRAMDKKSGQAILLKMESDWSGELWDSIKERLQKASSFDFRKKH